MRVGNRSSKFSVVGCLICVTLGSGVVEGQAPGPSAANLAAALGPLSGRELFEHEWTWIEPKEHPQEKERRSIRLTSSGSRALSVVMGDGLGPLHNATSCAQCHVAGGGAGVEHNVTLITVDPRSAVLKDTTKGGSDLMELFPGLLGPGGILVINTVVHDRSTRGGYQAIRSGLAQRVPGGIQDDWFVPEKRSIAAVADRPIVSGRHKKVDFYLSQRNSTALFGVGLIDLINPERLRALARRQAERSDGQITGRVAGRFGWRGQVASLNEFVIGACGAELGINVRSPSIRSAPPVSAASLQASDPADPSYFNAGSDMTSSQLSSLATYVASIPRPIERPEPQHSWQEVRAGEEVFNAIGCQSCHVADVHPISGLFSDLLLHDMGPKLQDPAPAPVGELVGVSVVPAPRFKLQTVSLATSGAGYYGTPNPSRSHPKPYPLPYPRQPQFPRGDLPEQITLSDWGGEVTWDSLQREWRTPPLWGVRDSGPYLHDGRAATLEDAILWHGGEADSSRQAFSNLSRADKDLVLAFLASLRAAD